MKDAAQGVEEPLADEVDSSRFDVIVDGTEFEGNLQLKNSNPREDQLFSSEMYWITHLVE